MEKVTHIRLAWAGGVHRFKIDQEATVSPSDLRAAIYEGERPRLHDREHAILLRLAGGGWGLDDVVTPIRVGLIGGGEFRPNRRLDASTWGAVDELIAEHVLRRPLMESLPLAQTILLATIVGIDPALAERGVAPMGVTAEDAEQGLTELIVQAQEG